MKAIDLRNTIDDMIREHGENAEVMLRRNTDASAQPITRAIWTSVNGSHHTLDIGVLSFAAGVRRKTMGGNEHFILLES